MEKQKTQTERFAGITIRLYRPAYVPDTIEGVADRTTMLLDKVEEAAKECFPGATVEQSDERRQEAVIVVDETGTHDAATVGFVQTSCSMLCAAAANDLGIEDGGIFLGQYTGNGKVRKIAVGGLCWEETVRGYRFLSYRHDEGDDTGESLREMLRDIEGPVTVNRMLAGRALNQEKDLMFAVSGVLADSIAPERYGVTAEETPFWVREMSRESDTPAHALLAMIRLGRENFDADMRGAISEAYDGDGPAIVLVGGDGGRQGVKISRHTVEGIDGAAFAENMTASQN